MSTAIPTSELHKETIRFADLLAKNQLHALEAIPKDQQELFFLALSAKHLPALVSAVRSTSCETQNAAFSSYVQLLSLLPDPDRNPYYRKYIVSAEFAPLPNLVASAFVEGIQWLRPSGPGHVCSLIMHILQWCDTDIGDDKRAAIDKAVRLALREKCRELMGSERWGDLDRYQQVEIRRLEGMLGPVEHMPTPPDQPGYLPPVVEGLLAGEDSGSGGMQRVHGGGRAVAVLAVQVGEVLREGVSKQGLEEGA
ncbi:hypothetical protein C8T65DRAFT_668954 [Cerioporus squamosus]|nr:hypothetical protein C8T65DRAFT_668954 [Cerioporus squamosus]